MKLFVGTLTVLSVVLLSSTAFAAGRGDGAVCKADIKTYCSGVKRGEGRIMQCLHEHTKEIAPACNTLVDKNLAAAATKDKATDAAQPAKATKGAKKTDTSGQ